MIDLIVPTIKGREDSLARCLDSYERNTARGVLNAIVIRDQPSAGKAWIEGLKLSSAPYVHLSCDDIEMTSPVWAGICMEIADHGKLPCPIVRRPDGSIESCGGDMNAPRCLLSEMQPDGFEVDFTVLPFGSREQMDAIGMIEAHYKSDTYFSRKGREFGCSTVIAHGYEVIHHHLDVGRIGPSRSDDRAYAEAMGG